MLTAMGTGGERDKYVGFCDFISQTLCQAVEQLQPSSGPMRTPQVRRLAPEKLSALKRLADTGPHTPRSYGAPAARLNANCEGTSYSCLLSIQDSYVYINFVKKTRDGHLLVTGELPDSTLANPFHHTFGFLAKLDESGAGLYAPNAFTPNNDRWNDMFRPIVGGIVESYEPGLGCNHCRY